MPARYRWIVEPLFTLDLSLTFLSHLFGASGKFPAKILAKTPLQEFHHAPAKQTWAGNHIVSFGNGADQGINAVEGFFAGFTIV